MSLNKILLVVCCIIIIIISLPLFVTHPDCDVKQINSKYQFLYFPESHLCYINEKKDMNGYVFRGNIEYFGISNVDKKLYCLVKKIASIEKDGWYSLDLSTDAIEFVKEANFDKSEFGKLYNIEIINVHTYFGDAVR